MLGQDAFIFAEKQSENHQQNLRLSLNTFYSSWLFLFQNSRSSVWRPFHICSQTRCTRCLNIPAFSQYSTFPKTSVIPPVETWYLALLQPTFHTSVDGYSPCTTQLYPSGLFWFIRLSHITLIIPNDFKIQKELTALSRAMSWHPVRHSSAHSALLHITASW